MARRFSVSRDGRNPSLPGADFLLSAVRSKMVRHGFFFLDIVQGKGYRRDNLLRLCMGRFAAK